MRRHSTDAARAAGASTGPARGAPVELLHVEADGGAADLLRTALERGGLDCELVRVASRADLAARVQGDDVEVVVIGSSVSEGQRPPVTSPSKGSAIPLVGHRDPDDGVDLEVPTRFLTRLLHDARNPLATIKLSLGVILAAQAPGIPAHLHRLLVNSDLAADRATDILVNLSELVRLRMGTVQLHREICDLRDPVRDALRLTEALARRHDHTVVAQLPSRSVSGSVDGALLERSVINLLGHAHTTGRRGQIVHVSLVKRHRQAIYAASYLGEGSSRPSPAGDPASPPLEERLGVGLEVSMAIARLHGGRLWVEGDPGAHRSVYLAIPVEGGSASIGRGRKSQGTDRAPVGTP